MFLMTRPHTQLRVPAATEAVIPVGSQGLTVAAPETQPIHRRSGPQTPDQCAREPARTVQRDLKTLVEFIRIYCQHRHPDREKSTATLEAFDLEALTDKPPALCSECGKLMAHALVKRSHCPMDPKPACKHCPSHCYHPKYREQIRKVMKYSGKKLILSGRLDYLFHLLF